MENKAEFKPDLKSVNKNIKSKRIFSNIHRLLAQKKYENFEDFLNKNPNYNEYLLNNVITNPVNHNKIGENVLKHFQEEITEVEYQMIIRSVLSSIQISENGINYSEESNTMTNTYQKTLVPSGASHVPKVFSENI